MSSAPKPSKCPICGDPAAHATRPFCSRRCRNIDFARWMTGRYAIAGTREDGGQEPQRTEDDGAGGAGEQDPTGGEGVD